MAVSATVANAMRQSRHAVFTPTLTGLGVREHLRASEVTLTDHINDDLAFMRIAALHDVALCGQSRGSMVVTGLADRVPWRIRLLAYLDAVAPRDGESQRDIAPPGLVDA